MKKTVIISVAAAVLLALAVAAGLWLLVIKPQQDDNKQLQEKVSAVQELAELEQLQEQPVQLHQELPKSDQIESEFLAVL